MEKLGGNPEQLRILMLAAHGPMSAKLASESLGKSLGAVSYHVRELAEAKLIRKLGQRKVRGAVATDYTISPKGAALLVKLGIEEDAGA